MNHRILVVENALLSNTSNEEMNQKVVSCFNSKLRMEIAGSRGIMAEGFGDAIGLGNLSERITDQDSEGGNLLPHSERHSLPIGITIAKAAAAFVVVFSLMLLVVQGVGNSQKDSNSRVTEVASSL